MKKLLKTVFVFALCLLSVAPMKSFATDTVGIQCYETAFSEDRMQQILDLNLQNSGTTRASDLIVSYNVAIAKNGSYIDMVAKIFCDVEVVKCGFKKIVLQKRASTSSSWSNALTLEDLYYDGSDHIVCKTFSVPSGYQYRVVCTFYAKKNLFVTQKIEITSNYVSFW